MSEEFEFEERDMKTLNAITTKISPGIETAVRAFMKEARDAGYEPRVCGAAFSLYFITSLANILMKCSGMPPELIQLHDIQNIASNVQELLAREVSRCIRIRSAETDPSRN